MPIIEILDGAQAVINTIVASEAFAEAHYPGTWRLAPPEEPPPVMDDPRIWWVDVGPFYDRFGPDALAIAASDHGACKAVQTLTSVRKYIDLRDPRVAAMIDMLIATGQPVAQPWTPGSGPMTPAKKAAILETPTTEYERHIKGLVAPEV